SHYAGCCCQRRHERRIPADAGVGPAVPDAATTGELVLYSQRTVEVLDTWLHCGQCGQYCAGLRADIWQTGPARNGYGRRSTCIGDLRSSIRANHVWYFLCEEDAG